MFFGFQQDLTLDASLCVGRRTPPRKSAPIRVRNRFMWSLHLFVESAVCLACLFAKSISLCPCRHFQLVGDNDWCLPTSMSSGSQGVANLSSADGDVSSRERITGNAGVLRPSRGAEDVYAQARTLFRAMVQMPHYAEEVRALGYARRLFCFEQGCLQRP